MPDLLDLPPLINEILTLTAQITIQELENAGRVDALPADEYPNMEIVEEIDDTTCDLCLDMDGQIISRDHPDFDEVQAPAHINCRRIMVGIGRDEVGPDDKDIEPDYERPAQELIDKHGHFMIDKEKYAQLRIPGQPEGRDFVVREFIEENGVRHRRIDWRIEPYGLEN